MSGLAMTPDSREIVQRGADFLQVELDRLDCPITYTACQKLAAALIEQLQRPVAGPPAFQDRVHPWMIECFGPTIPFDKTERNHRFLEEALELVQACGCPQNEAHQLVDYVYGRDQGDINQEVGGVMVTLAALCIANGFDMHEAGETELTRIWTKMEQIRAKQAAKPPLPVAAPAVGEREAIPLADHDEIGRKMIGQPWDIQAAIVTICAHCLVLTDKYPNSDASDLAGCISEQCKELTDAILALRSSPPQAGGEKPVAWRWRHVNRYPIEWTYQDSPIGDHNEYIIVEPLYVQADGDAVSEEELARLLWFQRASYWPNDDQLYKSDNGKKHLTDSRAILSTYNVTRMAQQQ